MAWGCWECYCTWCMHIVEPIAGDVADDSILMTVSRWEITQTDASCEDRTLHVFFNYCGGILADLEVLHNLCIWQHLFQGGDGIQVVLCVHAIHLKLLWLCVDGCVWVCGQVGVWICEYVGMWVCVCMLEDGVNQSEQVWRKHHVCVTWHSWLLLEILCITVRSLHGDTTLSD